jgi:hypothetical protein
MKEHLEKAYHRKSSLDASSSRRLPLPLGHLHSLGVLSLSDKRTFGELLECCCLRPASEMQLYRTTSDSDKWSEPQLSVSARGIANDSARA